MSAPYRHCRHCGDFVPHDAPSAICGRCACRPVAERGQRQPGDDDDRKPGRCIHCLAPVTAPAEVCKSCLELIADIAADEYVKPPPSNPRHNARWLLWACNKRGRLRDAQTIGRERGFPRNMLRWSVEQVAEVTAALVAAKPR